MKPKSLPSRLFQRDSSAAASGESLSTSAAKYQRHVDCVDHPETPDESFQDGQQVADSGRRHEKRRFSLLPQSYKPLKDDEAKAKAKEEKKKKKKENYKKVKKVGVFLFILHIFQKKKNVRVTPALKLQI